MRTGIEEAVGRFTRMLIGFGAPYSDLMRLGTALLLVSQEVVGESLLAALNRDANIAGKLEEKDIAALTVVAMLINPEDGKPDNCIH